MNLIADLQIHSRFSRATSSAITIQNLEKYARLKGINLLGTGDFTHPKWLAELKSELKEDGSGILTSKSGFNFVLQGEISNIYTQDGKSRRIHTLLLARNFDVVEQINQALLKKGRLDYDGRPIFGFSCVELVDMMRGISDDIEIIPAHAWTPWYGIFGSMSGFDSVEECFKEQSKHIHAIETGLSSDPAMNWRLSRLDKYTLLSSSDAHSFWPWRLGREANVFDIDLSYDALLDAIRKRKGFVETIEMWPHEGKYHYTGHRNCNVVLSPKESIKLKNICPKCRSKLTVGVAQRVEELADREEGFVPKHAVPFKNLIPLSEVIGGTIGEKVESKKVWEEYYKLTNAFGNEFEVVLNADEKELKKITSEKIAENIIRNRNQKIPFKPGYDGVYGVPIFEEKDLDSYKEEKEKTKARVEQKGLEEFI
ncbi:DNA helicase UvrD [Candidatus Woesearchaeota archaeon]|nr:DNA helicase UvrD [Candidatus Woesearchaeota archaeon]